MCIHDRAKLDQELNDWTTQAKTMPAWYANDMGHYVRQMGQRKVLTSDEVERYIAAIRELSNPRPERVMTPLSSVLVPMVVEMEIQVEVKTLRKTLTDALKENQAHNEKIWTLYVAKMGEYAQYLTRFDKAPSSRGLKQEPYLQRQDTRRLKEALQGLSIHIGTTIKIGDREYRELLDGTDALRAGGVAQIKSLSSLTY